MSFFQIVLKKTLKPQNENETIYMYMSVFCKYMYNNNVHQNSQEKVTAQNIAID